MADVISESYGGVKATTLDIVHEQGRLKSEYVCYANFECEACKWAKITTDKNGENG
jgi:hypothetical protein